MVIATRGKRECAFRAYLAVTIGRMATVELLDGYGPAGQAEYERLTAAFTFSAADEGRLHQYCRAVDEQERIDAELRKVKLATTGSRKQPAVHPLLMASIAHRALVLRLHDALRLPEESGTARLSPQARAARTRWQASATPRAV